MRACAASEFQMKPQHWVYFIPPQSTRSICFFRIDSLSLVSVILAVVVCDFPDRWFLRVFTNLFDFSIVFPSFQFFSISFFWIERNKIRYVSNWYYTEFIFILIGVLFNVIIIVIIVVIIFRCWLLKALSLSKSHVFNGYLCICWYQSGSCNFYHFFVFSPSGFCSAPIWLSLIHLNHVHMHIIVTS